MKNKLKKILFYLTLSFFIITNPYSEEIINFNVSEIEITQDGNLIKGFKGGEAFTNNGVSILAKEFEYNKISTHLTAVGDVIFKDKNKEITIVADKILYKKNEEEVVANGNVKITDNTKNLNIFANKIIYFKNSDQIKAIQNVLLQDNDTNTMIKAKG